MAKNKELDKAIADNPSLGFLTPDTAETKEQPVQTPKQAIAPAPEGYKINPLYIEKRTKRLQLMVPPSLSEKVKALADAEKRSINDLCIDILDSRVTELLNAKK